MWIEYYVCYKFYVFTVTTIVRSKISKILQNQIAWVHRLKMDDRLEELLATHRRH